MLTTDLLAMYREEKATKVKEDFPSFDEWKAEEGLITSCPADDLAAYELYKDEKQKASNFPTFAEWKKKFDKDWQADHAGSSFVDLAFGVELSDSEVAFIS